MANARRESWPEPDELTDSIQRSQRKLCSEALRLQEQVLESLDSAQRKAFLSAMTKIADSQEEIQIVCDELHEKEAYITRLIRREREADRIINNLRTENNRLAAENIHLRQSLATALPPAPPAAKAKAPPPPPPDANVNQDDTVSESGVRSSYGGTRGC